jgi:hypothetical protein
MGWVQALAGDRELACDALALEAAGEGRNKEYGRTILRLLEGFTDRVMAPGLSAFWKTNASFSNASDDRGVRAEPAGRYRRQRYCSRWPWSG